MKLYLQQPGRSTIKYTSFWCCHLDVQEVFFIKTVYYSSGELAALYGLVHGIKNKTFMDPPGNR